MAVHQIEVQGVGSGHLSQSARCGKMSIIGRQQRGKNVESSGVHRIEQGSELASSFARFFLSGTLPPGQRVPSVKHISARLSTFCFILIALANHWQIIAAHRFATIQLNVHEAI
jgi:hypothetical protein